VSLLEEEGSGYYLPFTIEVGNTFIVELSTGKLKTLKI
jgi:hypothetical protein